MRIGVVFPQTEIGADVGAVRAYATGVEQLGYLHLLAYDHVLGADPAVHDGWAGPYDVDTTFHEPLVLFGFLAGITTLELVSGVIILPQRQTALVAKQAAAVDVLCEGRFRLGIGIGWNSVEYEALGKDFRRSRREKRRAGRAAASPLHRAIRDVRGSLRASHRRRPRSSSGAATDPHLVRGGDTTRLSPCRSARRWLVPDDPAGAAARRGQGDRRRRHA